MKVVGLTGGIGSGKSTVARFFRERGAQVIDADEIARFVVMPGQPALADLVSEFGGDILDAAGNLDRPRMGALAFSSKEARARLNAITHPRIAEEVARRTARLAAEGASVALYEAALLVENRLHEHLAGLIVVTVPEALQLARVMERDSLTREEAERRIAAQLPLAAKISVATHLIDNSGSLENTRAQVETVWNLLLNESGARR